MSATKKTLLLAGLAALIGLQAAFFLNARLCWRAKAAAKTPEERIRLLRLADSVFPWNGAVAFELGRTYFEQGTESMADPAARDVLFRKSIDAYLRSLRLNPGSAPTHFELGQALLYAGYAGLPTPLDSFDEYRRAAELTGHDSQIQYDVGKILLGRWDSLDLKERDFVVGLLKSSIAGQGEDRLLDLLEAWNLGGRETGLIDRVLPEDAASLRTYARFLGERSLSLEARQAALARVDALQVARAKTEIDRARQAAESSQNARTMACAATALDALDSVKFYQALIGKTLFDPQEFKGLQTAGRRFLAMSRIEDAQSLDDPDGAIAAYLGSEDDPAALAEFETFLKDRGLLDERGGDTPFRSLKALAVRLALDLKLNKYRDIAGVEALVSSSLTVVPPSGRTAYRQILGLIGEADLRQNNVFDAVDYFAKAREVGGDSLDILLGLERCYVRLNDESKVADVRAAIARLMSPDPMDLGGKAVAKGQTVTIGVTTTGGPRSFRLEFRPSEPGIVRPLVSLFLDGRVVWENYGDTGFAEFTGKLRQGASRLEVTAVSAPIGLVRLSIAPAGPQ